MIASLAAAFILLGAAAEVENLFTEAPTTPEAIACSTLERIAFNKTDCLNMEDLVSVLTINAS